MPITALLRLILPPQMALYYTLLELCVFIPVINIGATTKSLILKPQMVWGQHKSSYHTPKTH